MLIASSTVLKRITGETGPKVSWRTTVISGVTRSSTVGEYSAQRRPLIDHGTHVRRGIERVSVPDGTRLLHQQFDETIGHALLNQHALDGRASLSRIPV